MSFELMNLILTELGIPFAYFQFKEPPTGDKYIAYFESEKVRFLADDKVYHHEPAFAVELYSFQCSPGVEPLPFTSDLHSRLRSLYTQ